MKRLFSYTYLISLIFIVGCNGKEFSAYEDEDVAATVRGEEITVGELRFLYPDDKVLDYLDGTIKAKLAVQEAKAMNIDVTEELEKIENTIDVVENYLSEENDSEAAKDIRSFAESQAAKLGMDPEDYYKEYTRITQETSVYVVAYIKEMLGEPKGVSEYNEQANQLLDDLVEENQESIQKLIN
jgi:hypothetical protein